MENEEPKVEFTKKQLRELILNTIISYVYNAGVSNGHNTVNVETLVNHEELHYSFMEILDMYKHLCESTAKTLNLELKELSIYIEFDDREARDDLVIYFKQTLSNDKYMPIYFTHFTKESYRELFDYLQSLPKDVLVMNMSQHHVNMERSLVDLFVETIRNAEENNYSWREIKINRDILPEEVSLALELGDK